MTDQPRLVGLRALGLGDFCCAVPAWKALRRSFPEHRTVLAAPAWQAPLLELVPAIDELLPTDEAGPIAWSGPRDEAGPIAWSGPRPDVAINLHGRGPRSTRLIESLQPTHMIAFRHPDVPSTDGGPEFRADEHETERWCRLLASGGTRADPSDLTLTVPSTPPAVDEATIVHPGAAAPARRWPAHRWAEVARTLNDDGHRVMVTGSEGERHLVEQVRQGAGLPPHSSVIGTRLDQLAALVAAARLVVSGDTGIAHLASGYATPSVVLFGPTPPSQWGPPTNGPHRVLWSGTTGDPHGQQPDPGLLTLDVADVLGAVEDRATAADRPHANVTL